MLQSSSQRLENLTRLVKIRFYLPDTNSGLINFFFFCSGSWKHICLVVWAVS